MKSNKQIIGYDRERLIGNIKTIMHDKNLKPSDLAKADIAAQPRISECLNPNGKANFTIEQLVMLAGYLQVSLDSLLGIGNTPNENAKNQFKDMAEIASSLFAINNVVLINFKALSIPCDPNDPEGDFIAENERTGTFKSRTALYFDNQHFNAFLTEWKDVSTSLNFVPVKQKMLDLWESDQKSRLAQRKTIWNFGTRFEEGKRFFEKFQKEYYQYCNETADLPFSSYVFIPNRKEEIELAEFYLIEQKELFIGQYEQSEIIAFAKGGPNGFKELPFS